MYSCGPSLNAWTRLMKMLSNLALFLSLIFFMESRAEVSWVGCDVVFDELKGVSPSGVVTESLGTLEMFGAEGCVGGHQVCHCGVSYCIFLALFHWRRLHRGIGGIRGGWQFGTAAYQLGVCGGRVWLLDIGDQGCFALDVLPLTSRVMGATGKRVFQTSSNVMCVWRGYMMGIDGCLLSRGLCKGLWRKLDRGLYIRLAELLARWLNVGLKGWLWRGLVRGLARWPWRQLWKN